MISCPECGSNEVRAHGVIQKIQWARRWPISPVRPKGETVAMEVSCAHCLYAFVARSNGTWRAAPMQNAHDLLKKATAAAVAAGESSGTGPKSHDEKPKARPAQARPAPDPRVRTR